MYEPQAVHISTNHPHLFRDFTPRISDPRINKDVSSSLYFWSIPNTSPPAYICFLLKSLICSAVLVSCLSRAIGPIMEIRRSPQSHSCRVYIYIYLLWFRNARPSPRVDTYRWDDADASTRQIKLASLPGTPVRLFLSVESPRAYRTRSPFSRHYFFPFLKRLGKVATSSHGCSSLDGNETQAPGYQQEF